jgi:hypothetical protein
MTANTHPEPQPLSQDTDEQSTVAAPDESSLIGTEPDEVIGNLDAGLTGSVEGEVPTCRNPAAGVEKLEAPQILALAFRMVSLAAPEPPERKPKRTFSRR